MQPPRADTSTPVRTTTVLLEHTLPDGSLHFDWLIERPRDQSEHRMITFRCQIDPLADQNQPWIGHRLPDHRAHYITHEGPVSNDRGAVRRLWSHPCLVTEEGPDRVAVTVQHPSTSLDLGITRGPDALWTRSLDAHG